MNAAQTQLYFREWAKAAQAHGWSTKAGIAAALAAHEAGNVWESPELNQSIAAIYDLAQFAAQRDGRDVTPDDLRHAVTVAALDRQASSKKFSNADFDKVLTLLRLLANPTNLDNLIAAQDNEAGERRRHVHVINRAPSRYWQRIMADRFGHTDLDRLTLEQLRQLSLTIRNRQRARTQPEAALQAA